MYISRTNTISDTIYGNKELCVHSVLLDAALYGSITICISVENVTALPLSHLVTHYCVIEDLTMLSISPSI